MKKYKVKEMFIGVTINIAGLGQIKVKAEHADIFARRRMYTYLEDFEPRKKLSAKKPSIKTDKDATFESE